MRFRYRGRFKLNVVYYKSVNCKFGTAIELNIYLNPYTFYITPCQLAFLGVIFIGLNFSALLWFNRKANRSANRFLAAALAVMVLWIARLLAIDLHLKTPLQFSLALGPLIFFYVLKTTRPEHKFSWKDLVHFIPVLAEQINLPDILLQLLVFISVSIYLYHSHLLILRFYQHQKFNNGDRYRHELRWLHKLLLAFGLLWLLWIPFTITGYSYDSLYLLLAGMMIWIAAVAHLRPVVKAVTDVPPLLKPSKPAELKQRGKWLRNVVKEKRYYEDPELSLSSLAKMLGLTTHELSRIINTGLKKNFNDFINEYRVRDVASKMQDPAYDRITLLGMAYRFRV